MDGNETSRTLKRDALGRVTVPREQREALVEEFERSGLPATQFARAAGINYQTFAWWIQQRRHARGDYARRKQARSAAIRLVEAVPAMSAALEPVAARSALEVHLPGNVIVRVTDAGQVPLAVQLIQCLRGAC